MTSSKSTKRALISSTLAILMCVAMLIGTTFAWFTDTASTGVNKIQAGNLDVQLLMHDGTDYVDIGNDTSPIFGTGSIAQNNNAATLWEPGKTQVAYLAIRNNGNLALKYKVELNVTNVSKNLYEVMEYAITPDATNTNPVSSWTTGNSVVEGTQVVANNVSLAKGATHYFALSVHMKEEAGNDYQGGEVDFDLTVLATQDTVESDSFGNDYDKFAEYPEVTTVQIAAGEGTAVNDDVKNAITAAKAVDPATGKTTPTQIVLPANTTVTLESGVATPAQGQTSDIKITGDKTTKIEFQNSTGGSDGSGTTYQDGANLTFQGVTISGGTEQFVARGGVVTFIDCTINGEIKKTTADKFVFSGCSFTAPVSQANYGCKDIVFDGCKFDTTDGYGIKIYSEGYEIAETNNLTVKNCEFKNSANKPKAAIFLDHIIDGLTYNITVDNCTFDGFTAEPTADNKWNNRVIIRDSFINSDGQYVFAYQTGNATPFHHTLNDSQLVVTV